MRGKPSATNEEDLWVSQIALLPGVVMSGLPTLFSPQQQQQIHLVLHLGLLQTIKGKHQNWVTEAATASLKSPPQFRVWFEKRRLPFSDRPRQISLKFWTLWKQWANLPLGQMYSIFQIATAIHWQLQWLYNRFKSWNEQFNVHKLFIWCSESSMFGHSM